MKKKKVRRKNSFFYARRRFVYKLLMICLIVLFFIVLAYLIFFVLEKISEKFPAEETEMGGELKTLCIFCEENKLVLDVLNYNILDNNQTINVTINWSSGTGDIKSILFIFNRTEGKCNYTSYDLPSYGLYKDYRINSNDSNCGVNNFTNITGVESFAWIDIHLTQIQKIENASLYKNENAVNIINLSSYFSCLENISFILIENPENDNIRAEINNQSLVSFYLVMDWFGAQKFNLTASCGGEILNVSSKGENMTFYVIVLNQTRPSVNHAPVFNSSYCDDLSWERNRSYVLEIEKCFYDEDNNTLAFRYENSSNGNLSISRSDNDLTLTPSTNWNGTGYFYVYANDSKDETRGSVDFRVFKIINITTNITINQTNLTINNTPKIKTSFPSSTEINLSSNGSLELSIEAENYDSIKWYVDGVLVKSNVISYNAEGLSEGEHEIKVEVKKGANVISKIWSLFVLGEEEAPKKSFFVYLLVIFVMLGILILIVIFLIVKSVGERKEESREKPEIKELKPGTRIGYIPPSHPVDYFSR